MSDSPHLGTYPTYKSAGNVVAAHLGDSGECETFTKNFKVNFMFRILRVKHLAALVAFLCFSVASSHPVKAENDTLTTKIAPPIELTVKDTPDDGGGS